jgi:hypothetical protein
MQRFLISAGFTVLAYSALAAALLLFAPVIAGWFDRGSPSPRPIAPAAPLQVRDYYLIAARLLGAYAILHAVAPTAGLVRQLVGPGLSSQFAEQLNWSYVVQAVAYLAASAFLILKADSIADIFCRSHRRADVPDPGPQGRRAEA